MHGPPSRPEQALRRSVSDEGVLKTIPGVRRGAAAEDELRRRKTAHGFVQVSPGKSRDLGEKGVVKLATDAGGNLRYLLRGPQPVEPLHQRALKRRRNFAFGPPGPAMRVDDPAFEECLCQLLDKERDGASPLQNGLKDFRRHRRANRGTPVRTVPAPARAATRQCPWALLGSWRPERQGPQSTPKPRRGRDETSRAIF